MVLGSEWLAGDVRARVRQRALVRHGEGLFAGFSPAAGPRLFDGAYHYDMGLVRFTDAALQFSGDRACFSLDKRLIERVWLGDGPRHWTPRKVVYIECRPSIDESPVIFSLQPLEAWFWPFTVSTAKRLFASLEEWRQSSPSNPVPPIPCSLPQVEGNPNTFITFRTAVRGVGIYCGIALVISSLKIQFTGSTGFLSPAELLIPVAVCCVLAVFLMWPRLPWNKLKTMGASPSRLPADS